MACERISKAMDAKEMHPDDILILKNFLNDLYGLELNDLDPNEDEVKVNPIKFVRFYNYNMNKISI